MENVVGSNSLLKNCNSQNRQYCTFSKEFAPGVEDGSVQQNPPSGKCCIFLKTGFGCLSLVSILGSTGPSHTVQFVVGKIEWLAE